MLNFSNLNDLEFEALCKDVMSRKLKRTLQRFGPGRDGGIDLTDDAYRRSTIVQVKHYTKSGFSSLLTSLKAEIPKVKKNKPKKYYVCCSTELTPDNKRDIYLLFSDYMESTNNVISLTEINDFLEDAANADILRKHFKLWLSSTNVLTEILTGDIGIDSEMLAIDIEQDTKNFVRTSAFDLALSCMAQSNALIITGNPGSGKTITSKMLILHYLAQGYRLRFTSAGADLAALKRALSQNPESQEIILLDDCFGQAYFNMKESQGTELTQLIKYVNIHPSKKLLMNSRVSIFQEAQERTPDLVKCFDKKLSKTYVLNMDNLSYVEKAQIFYNHLYFQNLPQEYLANIRYEKKYRDIVKHKNFNPRIIEFVCTPKHWKSVAAAEYSAFVLRCLDNPEQIWQEEYEYRLSVADRILVTTLFSLTESYMPLEFVRKCYNHRVDLTPNLDSSIDHFEQALRRLSGSMINIVDFTGTKFLTVANPSVNDFIRAYIKRNEAERKAILSASCAVHQWLNVASTEEECTDRIKAAFKDKSILNLVFETDAQKNDYIVYGCSLGFACDEAYKPYVEKYLAEVHDLDVCTEHRIDAAKVLDALFSNPVCSYYGLSQTIQDPAALMSIMNHLEVYGLVKFIQRIEGFFTGSDRSLFLALIQPKLEEEIALYCTDVPADSYDLDVGHIVADFSDYGEFGYRFDEDAAASAIDDMIMDDLSDELYTLVDDLPEDIKPSPTFLQNLDMSVDGSSRLVAQYMREDYDYDDYRAEYRWDNDAIDQIFYR